MTEYPFKLESIRESKNTDGQIAQCVIYNNHPDGDQRIITGGWDQKIKVFNLKTMKNEKIIASIKNTVFSLHLIEISGKWYLLSGDYNFELKIWTLPDFKEVKSFKFPGYVWRVIIVRDEKDRPFALCGCCCGKKNVRAVDLKKAIDFKSYKKHREVYRFKGTFSCIHQLERHTNECAIGGSSDKNLALFNWKTGDEIFLSKNKDGWMKVLSSFYSNGKEKILSGSGDKFISVWSRGGENEKRIGIANDSIASFLKFSDEIIFFGSGRRNKIGYIDTRKMEAKILNDEKLESTWDGINHQNWISKRKGDFKIVGVGNYLSIFNVIGLDVYCRDLDEDLTERVEYVRNQEDWTVIRVSVGGVEICSSKFLLLN